MGLMLHQLNKCDYLHGLMFASEYKFIKPNRVLFISILRKLSSCVISSIKLQLVNLHSTKYIIFSTCHYGQCRSRVFVPFVLRATTFACKSMQSYFTHQQTLYRLVNSLTLRSDALTDLEFYTVYVYSIKSLKDLTCLLTLPHHVGVSHIYLPTP